ncbi:MAG: hypothetical protein QY322_01460 [bacterium]|nr:MAG: hypothetical protein QY322_01460 [bacterium]
MKLFHITKLLLKVFFVAFFLLLTVYVYPKSPDFPNPPSDFVQSFEPADVETPLRRGYYTNLTRAEVIAHYEKEFNQGFNIYTPRLNYPPEDAPALIRDQTKSTFLEEIVHPLRESIYINGFEPKEEQYAQISDDVRYRQKIIIRYMPSSEWVRIIVVALATVFGYLLFAEYINVKNKN